MSLKINGSTSGSVTLDAPATGGDVTLTLPTFGFGKVLQVVYASTTTETLIASTSYTDTTLSATITPSASTSKVLVFATQNLRAYRETNNDIYGDVNIVRASTQVAEFGRCIGGRAALSGGSDLYYYGLVPLTYLDSPNTTSATTYKTQARASTTTNNGRVTAQINSATSSLVLIEVGP